MLQEAIATLSEIVTNTECSSSVVSTQPSQLTKPQKPSRESDHMRRTALSAMELRVLSPATSSAKIGLLG